MSRSRAILSRTWVLHSALVFLVALSVKFAYLRDRLQLPDVDHPTMDSLFHDQWARGLAFDTWTPDQEHLRHEPYFRAPLYPYFVSVVYRCFGTSARVLFALQHVLGALTVLLIFWFCSQVFDRRTAWVAVVLHLGYWPFTYHEAERLIPALSLALDMLFLVTLAVAGRAGKTWYAALAGVFAGLSAIARPSILIVIPFATAWLWKRVPKRRGQRLTLMVAATATMVAPVTIRNVVVGHDAVLIASQGGVNFFIGNNPQSNGVTAVVPDTRADWWGGFDDTRRIAEEDLGRKLKPSEVSRYWYGRGLRFLADEPLEAGRLYLRKVAILLGNAEPSNERQLYFRRKNSTALSLLIVNFAFLLATSLVGWMSIRKTRTAGERSMLDRSLPLIFAAPYALGIALFFVTSRYRLPVAMFLIPLSAVGCLSVFDLVRASAWRWSVPQVTLSAAVFALSMWNPFQVGGLADSRGEYGLGVDYYRTGDYRMAMDALNRSLAEDPGYAPAWTMRGRVNDRLGDSHAAIRDLQTACGLDSGMSDAYLWLGVAYQKTGQHQRAEREYLRAVKLDPRRVEALNNLADVYLREGRLEEALVFLQKALSVDSTFVNAIYGMGYYYELSGQYQMAAAAYRRAMPYPPARARLELINKRRGETQTP